MSEIWIRRTINGLQPIDELPTSWKIGDDLLLNVRKPRDLRLHKKAFALAKVFYQHSEYPSIEMARKALTIGAGYVDELINPMTGEVSLQAKSWEFGNMDNIEFEGLYKRMLQTAIKCAGGLEDDWELAVNELARF